MKKVYYKISAIILLFSAVLSSCTKDFTTINTDPNNTPNALPQQLLAPALNNIMNYNLLRNRNYNNELMQVTVNMGDGQGQVFRYDVRDDLSPYLYNGWYTELTNLKDIYKMANEEVTFNTSYQGISLICQSWVYSLLTDTYGDVPYFESNLGKDSLNFEPKFDSQKSIYLDIFNKLEQADTLLKKGTAIIPSSDPIYNGDVTKWRKFGNSLYLRLLLRLSGKAEVSAMVVPKITQVFTDSTNYPIMTSNADAAVLKWTGGAFVSPFVSVRPQDFRTPGICSFFIDHLVAWSDPRIDIPTYGTSGYCRWGIAPLSGRFVGVPGGYAPGSGAVKGAYFYGTDQTPAPAVTMQTDPMTGMMMNYAELQFILAECAVKGYIPGNANTYYRNGVLNSITQWVTKWPTASLDAYLTNGNIAWDDKASVDAKMEMIHLQKYYALFMTDMQQWIEYRRTGHPILPQGAGLVNNGIMPARMKYPVYVQSTNPTNYKLAVAAQGPDEMNTQVWWQKP